MRTHLAFLLSTAVSGCIAQSPYEPMQGDGDGSESCTTRGIGFPVNPTNTASMADFTVDACLGGSSAANSDLPPEADVEHFCYAKADDALYLAIGMRGDARTPMGIPWGYGQYTFRILSEGGPYNDIELDVTQDVTVQPPVWKMVAYASGMNQHIPALEGTAGTSLLKVAGSVVEVHIPLAAIGQPTFTKLRGYTFCCGCTNGASHCGDIDSGFCVLPVLPP
jgi:hypothetical protein